MCLIKRHSLGRSFSEIRRSFTQTKPNNQAQWASAREGARAAVEKAKPDLSWLGKGECGRFDSKWTAPSDPFTEFTHCGVPTSHLILAPPPSYT